MKPGTMEARLVDACLALGHICVEEAKWIDEPNMRAAMVWHAIGFLDAARGFLPVPPRPASYAETSASGGRNRSPVVEEGYKTEGA